MIASLTGRVAGISGGCCLLEVGGVGFEIRVPLPALATLAEAPGEVKLYTYLYLREDGVQLFGFLHPEEKQVFLQLLGVAGVGPKIALSLLSVLSVDRIRQAVAAEDYRLLASVPGIGPKTAQRLVFELRGKLAPTGEGGKTPSPVGGEMADAVEALIALGYPSPAATAAVEAAVTEGTERTAPALVRAALKKLLK
ncbi:MAG: Holliday junction branch migration protein RuvA [Firmicutes bacterium]|nr:Holliday junction branch migration protein RuvA [Bacillota bacterium]